MGTGRVTAEPDPTRGERDALTQNAHVSRPASGYVDRGKDPAARGIDPRKSDGALPVFPPPEATQPLPAPNAMPAAKPSTGSLIVASTAPFTGSSRSSE